MCIYIYIYIYIYDCEIGFMWPHIYSLELYVYIHAPTYSRTHTRVPHIIRKHHTHQ